MTKDITLYLFFVAVFLSNCDEAICQVRFYADYASLPFSEGASSNFNVLTGIKLDPNKEILIGIGLRGRFTPQNFDSNLRYSQSSFSLGFNYYHTRRLYSTIDFSLLAIKNVIDSFITKPFDLNKSPYFSYELSVSYILLRRLHFSAGFGLVDFSSLLNEVEDDIIELKKVEPNLALSLKLYLFQIPF